MSTKLSFIFLHFVLLHFILSLTRDTRFNLQQFNRLYSKNVKNVKKLNICNNAFTDDCYGFSRNAKCECKDIMKICLLAVRGSSLK